MGLIDQRRATEIRERLEDARTAYRNGQGGIAGTWSCWYLEDAAELLTALVEAEQQRDGLKRLCDTLVTSGKLVEAELASARASRRSLREALERILTFEEYPPVEKAAFCWFCCRNINGMDDHGNFSDDRKEPHDADCLGMKAHALLAGVRDGKEP